MTSSNPKFRRNVNIYMALAVLTFCTCLVITLNSVLPMYRYDIEKRFRPVFTDRIHTEWQQDSDGLWSAIVFLDKQRGTCVYVKDQIETVVGVTPSGDIIESRIEYIGDDTPGSNRSEGWQQLDKRVKFVNPAVVEGTVLRGATLHGCNPEFPTVTNYGPFVVGSDQDPPYFVQAWIENNRRGGPNDYRKFFPARR